ncbi:prolipoprotein diacylglyceryl transferase [Lacisediminihabitans sp.]|uniref:prolipoprotein diacylglyceryl transferase n=1 Tax=Lacisediminihabitans sp. TaxID=2787631 RepID=UPI00374CB30E
MVLPASIPSPDQSWQVFNLGQWLRDIGLSWFGFDINIRAYAVCILIGIVVATVMTYYRLKRRGADGGVVLDIALWAVPFGIIGARFFHVITHPDDYFGPTHAFWHVFAIWEGGIAIFGALIFGALGTYIGCRIAGVRFWSFADALAPGLLLAQAFGRFGNWFNHELFGLPTNLPWGLEIESSNPAFPAGLPAGTLFHPTFLYEIIWNVIGVIVLLAVERKHSWRRSERFGLPVPVPGAYRLQWGKVLGLYLVWYGIGRSFFESIRIDPSLIFLGVRTNVWAAWGAVLVGLVIIVVQTRRHPGLEPSVYLPGREWSPAAAVDSDDTYTDSDEDGNDAEVDTTTPSVASKARKSVTSEAGPRS